LQSGLWRQEKILLPPFFVFLSRLFALPRLFSAFAVFCVLGKISGG
jgi:hypothetical protein